MPAFNHLCPPVFSSAAALTWLLDVLKQLCFSLPNQAHRGKFPPQTLVYTPFFFELIFNSECQPILRPDKQRTDFYLVEKLLRWTTVQDYLIM